MDGDAYVWRVANDVYLNSDFQTVIDLQLYGIKVTRIAMNLSLIFITWSLMYLYIPPHILLGLVHAAAPWF